MTTLEVTIDDAMKQNADQLFGSLGLDTSTAIKIFLRAAIEHKGIPFPVRHQTLPKDLMEAVVDSREGRNLCGPFDSADAAVASMLED